MLLTFLLTFVSGCDVSDSADEEGEELNRLYTEDEVNYFTEIAFGSTYGSNLQKIRKWTEDIKVEVSGTPTAEDLQELDIVIEELNEIIDPIQLHLVDEDPTTKIYFVQPDEFEQYIPDSAGAYGFFWISYYNCEIYKATILISTEVTQKRRSHIIREEITQSLGITRDSYKYPDSIFYDPVSEVTEFAAVDEKVIEMLYRSNIEPCMQKKEARKVLENIER